MARGEGHLRPGGLPALRRRCRRGRARRRADARRGRVDPPAGGRRRARRVRWRDVAPGRLREPLLISSTDGVGTKTAIAAALHRYDTIGIDLVAMCADDVVCCGAEPLFFLDYVAVGQRRAGGGRRAGRLDRRRLPDGGLRARGRRDGRASGPHGRGGVRPGGLLRRRRRARSVIDGSAVRAGDVIVGLGSSGLHCERLLARALARRPVRPRPDGPYQEQLHQSLGDRAPTGPSAAEPEHAMATLGEVLLTPTRIYARTILAARAADRARRGSARPRPYHRRRPAGQCPAGPAGRPRRRIDPDAGRCRPSWRCSGRSAGSTTTSCGRRSTAASA